MSEIINPSMFLDSLPKNVDFEQFKNQLEQFLTEQDKVILGDNAIDVLGDNLAYLGVFASEPASFDIEAVAGVAMINEDVA